MGLGLGHARRGERTIPGAHWTGRIRRTLSVLAVIAMGGIVGGCRSTGPGAEPREPLPGYGEIVERYNGRTADLGRMWARAVISLRYFDVDGDRRSEQGDGHVQRLDAWKVAISVGKLGETLFWLGADEDRYWVFDLTTPDHTVAYVGRHDELTAEKARRAGLTIPPHEYLRLAGLSPLPREPDGATIGRTDAGLVLLELDDRGVRWRLDLDPLTLEPASITLFAPSGEAALVSELTDYQTVDLSDRGIDEPRAPGRVRIAHPASETEISVTIDGDIIDGVRSGKPRSRVFEFEVLVEALAPDEVIDLDLRSAPGDAP